MSGRIFQNVVLQYKETTDRVIGDIDNEGTVIACIELTGIGKKWPRYVEAIEAAENSCVAIEGKTFKAMPGWGNHFDYAVFASGDDSVGRTVCAMATVALNSAKTYYEEKHDKGSFIKNIISDNILISDIGKVIELTPNSAKINGTVPAGRVFVDGYGVGDVGSVVLRDRKHLAEDGMIVVVVSMSGEDGSVVSGPDIITRGFVYVKESEGLMEELRKVAVKALEECRMDTMNDWASIKSEIKNAISGFLYKKTKRNPMILPVIMEV